MVKSEYETKQIFPAPEDCLMRLNLHPLSRVKVVILDRTPIRATATRAHGLCFSVKPDVAVPPSLVNYLIRNRKRTWAVIFRTMDIRKPGDQGVLY